MKDCRCTICAKRFGFNSYIHKIPGNVLKTWGMQPPGYGYEIESVGKRKIRVYPVCGECYDKYDKGV